MIQIFDTLAEYNNYTSNDENLSSGILYYVKEDGSGHFFTNNIDGENKIYDLGSGGSSDELIELIEGTAEVINIPNGTTIIGEYAFNNKKLMKTVVIPTSVESIEKNAFYACTSLTNITIPNSVTAIKSFAFTQCAFTNITIPNSVTYIEEYAFTNCGNLTSVTIGDGVTNMFGYAFGNNSNLATVYILAKNPPTITQKYGSYDVFYGTSSNLVIYVPADSVDAYKAASGWSAYADKIQAIPE